MFLFALLALVAVILLAAYIYEQRCLSRFVVLDKKNKPAKIPSLGLRQFVQLLFDKAVFKSHKHYAEHVADWMRVYPQQNVGLFVRFLGHIPVIFVFDPESMHSILSNSKLFPKLEFPTGGLLHKSFGHSFGMQNGEQWRNQRSIVNPSFTGVERFKPVIQQSVDTCMQKFKELRNVKNIKEWMSRFTLDVLGDSTNALWPFLIVRYSWCSLKFAGKQRSHAPIY